MAILLCRGAEIGSAARDVLMKVARDDENLV